MFFKKGDKLLEEKFSILKIENAKLKNIIKSQNIDISRCELKQKKLLSTFNILRESYLKEVEKNFLLQSEQMKSKNNIKEILKKKYSGRKISYTTLIKELDYISRTLNIYMFEIKENIKEDEDIQVFKGVYFRFKMYKDKLKVIVK